LPFTSRAWRALQEAVGAAIAAHQGFTGTRELLIGLLAEDRSRAAAVLKDSGVTLALLRRHDALPS
jgi:ATP-dependent Clp protease ATP-binding subunit ClpA